MDYKECVAMVLAGGNGNRLGALTKDIAKPCVHFGGRYRIIDFTLSNCAHSGINTLGVLSQYRAAELHAYVSNGQAWELDKAGGLFVLPSSMCESAYTGTANAVYQNISFIDKFSPEHVLILSADQIYKMDYSKMLDLHKKTKSDATISTIPVRLEDASRFGIVSVSEDGRITEFEEKPERAKSNLASMGIYIFKWSSLKRYLIEDQSNNLSEHDFGKNIIPAMLAANEKMCAYKFHGYWRDVGTVQSLWESNMDLISDNAQLDLYDRKWEIFTQSGYHAPCYMAARADVKRSILADGCHVYGKVNNSVLFDSVTICEGAEVIDSVVMAGAFIGKNAKIHKAVIGAGVRVGEHVEIGANCGLSDYVNNKICSWGVSLIAPGVSVGGSVKIGENSYIDMNVQQKNPDRRPMAKRVVKSELSYI